MTHPPRLQDMLHHYSPEVHWTWMTDFAHAHILTLSLNILNSMIDDRGQRRHTLSCALPPLFSCHWSAAAHVFALLTYAGAIHGSDLPIASVFSDL